MASRLTETGRDLEVMNGILYELDDVVPASLVLPRSLQMRGSGLHAAQRPGFLTGCGSHGLEPLPPNRVGDDPDPPPVDHGVGAGDGKAEGVTNPVELLSC